MSLARRPSWAPLGALLALGTLLALGSTGCATGDSAALSFPWHGSDDGSDSDEATFGPLEDFPDTEDSLGAMTDPEGESGAGDGTQLPAPICSVGGQDCPEGEKCTIWANDGGDVPNEARCMPLTAAAQPGDACTIYGVASGIDTCDAGSYCLVNGTTVYPYGVCTPFCQGPFGMAQCDDPDAACGWAFDGVGPLCLQTCDVAAQDCPDGQTCFEQVVGPPVCFA